MNTRINILCIAENIKYNLHVAQTRHIRKKFQKCGICCMKKLLTKYNNLGRKEDFQEN